MIPEFQLIRKLTGTVGDDCSIHRIGNREILVTVDSLVEDVHFKRSWANFDLFGEKLAGAALSDIAAMGGKPLFAWIALEVSKKTSQKECRDFYRGLNKVFKRFKITLEGGNTTCSKQFGAHLTVWGECKKGKALCRNTARIGDLVFLIGNLGWAALGLKTKNKKYRNALLKPKPLIKEGQKLSGKKGVHSCIDVSDGLLQDLGHIAHASKVHVLLEADKIPMTPDFIKTTRRLKLDPLKLALTGGEDYALVYTGRHAAGTLIGKVIRGKPGVTLLDKNKKPITFLTKGFQHATRRVP